MKKVLVVAGTRPEAIKMAPLSLELKKSDKFETLFVSTAQHRQMLDQALEIFGISPDYDMNVMRQGQTLTSLTASILNAWGEFYSKNNPDLVLIQGDTTTVFASAIAAFYKGVKIGHVEAGLRTFNMQSPFPEEMNRTLVSPLADFSFAPTSMSLDNLIKEGRCPDKCFVTGNTVVDALQLIAKKLENNNVSFESVAKKYAIDDSFFSKFMEKGKWILVTGHRRESFGDGFENICLAINEITKRHPDYGIVYPVHLNPNVQEPVNRILANNPNISLISPLGYEDFICMMKYCRFILSDSGGVQEEAPSLGKPVLVMRENTERPEGVIAGTCVLVGTDVAKIVKESDVLIDNEAEYLARSALKNPYGDGTASKQIREILEKNL